ncbi:MAG TPA: MarR family EPS-associated transcriptional regulator [Gammaproteobacteria bacterium]|nr:MarR family EPS-associated transcriptional regulator [Gammaproteobacteria bacterium]
MALDDETRYRLFKALEAHPELTQRQLAEELGMSVGKANYCLRALIDRGWVKLSNFRDSSNKRGYVYFLTPQGFTEKARVARRFLQRKREEYESLEEEIEELRAEIGEAAGKGTNS